MIVYKIHSCKCNEYGLCGNTCLLDDPCSKNPCANGGICIERCTDVADYYCNCTNEYVGKNCTEQVGTLLTIMLGQFHKKIHISKKKLTREMLALSESRPEWL